MNRDVIEQYAAGGEKLRRAVAGLTPDELRARPGPGAWSVLEVIIHLADSDAISIDRMKRILLTIGLIALGAATAVTVAGAADSRTYQAELFNAFNTPQFNNPATVLGNASFGVINSAAVAPRITQLALKPGVALLPLEAGLVEGDRHAPRLFRATAS